MKIPITIEGAREHNLKDINIVIPTDSLVVISGPSGSGKSSLAFDTLYAESQRRFIDCLPLNTRKHFQLPNKPDADRITGLSPAICIEQKAPSFSSRTQLGSITGILDYLRILYSTIGIPHDPITGKPLTRYSSDQIIQEIEGLNEGTRLTLIAPISKLLQDSPLQTLQDFQRLGFLKITLNHTIVDIEDILLDPPTTFEQAGLVIDRIVHRGEQSLSRLADSLETALKISPDLIEILIVHPETREEEQRSYHTLFHNPETGLIIPNLSPKLFSYNSPQGYCPRCEGRGKIEVTEICTECHGERLNPLSRAVSIKIGDTNYTLPQLLTLNFQELAPIISLIPLPSQHKESLNIVIEDLGKRFYYLNLLGLGYLSPDRAGNTLSGGELQRARLAGQLGGGLSGVLYILDEPTRGLHPEDTQKLLSAMQSLRDKGNTVLCIEHDDWIIKHADHIIDIGPGSGPHGGHILAEGTPEEISNNENSPTGAWLSGRNLMPFPPNQGDPIHHVLTLKGATSHNIYNLELKLPLGHFIGLAGPSGSGKSTLVQECLIPAIKNQKQGKTWQSISGNETIDKVILIDQSPIGNNPRSNPASATGLLSIIRQLYAQLPLSKQRGYKADRFTTMSKGGRCERCQGLGYMELDLDFLSSNLVECEACHGKRYNRETLEVTWKGKSIADLLALSISELKDFFKSIPKAHKILSCLDDLGLGYLSLDRAASSLSGGESQRIKIATELSKQIHTKDRKASQFHLFILDEPTTGLHFNEINLLILALLKLKRMGHTVLCIEHNIPLLSSVDYLIDMGPGAGSNGGKIVNEGTLGKIIGDSVSPTAKWLSLPIPLS